MQFSRSLVRRSSSEARASVFRDVENGQIWAFQENVGFSERVVLLKPESMVILN